MVVNVGCRFGAPAGLRVGGGGGTGCGVGTVGGTEAAAAATLLLGGALLRELGHVASCVLGGPPWI